MAGECSFSNVEKEINRLKRIFQDDIKILTNIGEILYSLKVKLGRDDVFLKIQITDEYPAVSPQVIVSGPLPTDAGHELSSKLKSIISENPGKFIVTTLIDTAIAFVREHAPGTTGPKQKPELRRSPVEDDCRKKAKAAQEEDVNEKLPSMKTCDDVIHRIRWDESLNQDDFFVGYEDRFVGLIEKPFSDFTWNIEDAAGDDPFNFSVPFHRVTYFKYKTQKVWDKTERLDLVFGSTGSQVTICDVIQKWADEN